MDLVDIYRTFHLKTTEYTFFSSAHGTFSRIDHIFSDHNAMRLDINYRKKRSVKYTNTWRVNDTLLNNQEITEEIRGNQKIPRNK